MSAESQKHFRPKNLRIMGVDPGSRLTGYGCIELSGRKIVHVKSGVIRLMEDDQDTFEGRLLKLHQELNRLIVEIQPAHLVVEKVFFAKNAMSALKLGQARGVVLLAGAIHQLDVFEYSVTETKQALTGHGRAEKEQVAKLVEFIIGKQNFATLDVSDALSLAICHSQQGAPSASPSGSRGRKTTSLAKALQHSIPTVKRNP